MARNRIKEVGASLEAKNHDGYKPAEISSAFGVSRYTVRQWRLAGCPCVCINSDKSETGKRFRFSLQSVRAWLENRTQKGGEA